MQSKADLTLKQVLAGKWGQFMDSRKTGIRLGLGLALLVLPVMSAWAASDVTAANFSSNAAGDVVITLGAGDITRTAPELVSLLDDRQEARG